MSRQLTSAPLSNRWRAVCRCPLCTARLSGVSNICGRPGDTPPVTVTHCNITPPMNGSQAMKQDTRPDEDRQLHCM